MLLTLFWIPAFLAASMSFSLLSPAVGMLCFSSSAMRSYEQGRRHQFRDAKAVCVGHGICHDLLL